MEKQNKITDYDRNFSWREYNESQTKEKTLFVQLLGELCEFIEERPVTTVGRKPTKMKDIVFSLVMKQYLDTSSRRVHSDLRIFQELGYLEKALPFTTLLEQFGRDGLRELLTTLIEISSLPLKNIEFDFAIDSTGFGISRYKTFFNMKHNGEGKWKQFRKCHAVCGVKTNIVTAVEITEGYVGDNTQFAPLVNDTARNFRIRDFCADRAYLSGNNFALVDKLGGKAFIPFKKNSTGKGVKENRSFFKKAYREYTQNPESYMGRYHKRSNIESTFSMIKRRFGNNVKCKKEISQDVEILGKILAHNICVIIQEFYLNKIDTDFNNHMKTYVVRK